jgi:hypothetical protein
VREISNVVVDNKNYSPFDTGASAVLLHGFGERAHSRQLAVVESTV